MAEVLEGLQQVLNTPADAGLGRAGPAAAALPPGQKASYQITFVPGTDLLREGMDPLLLLRDLSRLGEVTGVKADLSQLPDLAEMDPASCYLGWTLNLVTDQPPAAIEEIFSFVKNSEPGRGRDPGRSRSGCGTPGRVHRQARSESGADFPARKLDDSSIRVAIDKVDRLVNLVEELVISQSMLDQAMGDFSVDRLGDLREAVGTMNRNLPRSAGPGHGYPHGAHQHRLRPLPSPGPRAGRLFGEKDRLRDGRAGNGTGQAGHRAHGRSAYSSSAQRRGPWHRISGGTRALGKPPEGTIRLAAFHQGDNIVIEVSDDGRGLDPSTFAKKPWPWE